MGYSKNNKIKPKIEIKKSITLLSFPCERGDSVEE